MRGLHKSYKQLHLNCKLVRDVAVSDLSFSLQAGECLALLGVNGSGKTTTFKAITKEIMTSKQTNIKIDGHNIMQEFDKARKLIGYCPQYDLIFESMSVEEHLHFYA